MPLDGVERRLSAILSADVVGYSRLMAEDEDGTVRRLAAYRDEITLLVEQHGGRIVTSLATTFSLSFPVWRANSAERQLACRVLVADPWTSLEPEKA